MTKKKCRREFTKNKGGTRKKMRRPVGWSEMIRQNMNFKPNCNVRAR